MTPLTARWKRSPVDALAPDVLVEAHGVGVFRAHRWLVRDVDVTVRRGEIVTLIGPNGSGKTTTARMIVGAQKPDAGVVRRTPGLRIGYVPQDLAMDRTPPLTVTRLMTLTASHPRPAVRNALEAVGITRLADAEVTDLSGGEFQRALLARAILRKPDLLVLDEPVQGVDFPGEVALYRLIRDIRDQIGCGVLLISHDLHVVMAATDTVICLNGHVSCRGTPQAVVSHPVYRQLFGQAAADTLAVYQHRHDNGQHPHDTFRPLDPSPDDTGNPGDART